MIEAALVLPLSIFLIMGLFTLALHYHEQAVRQTENYCQVRQEAKVEGKTDLREAEFVTKVDFLQEVVDGKEKKSD